MGYLQQEELPYRTLEDEMLSPLRGVELTEAGAFVAGLIVDARSERPVTIAEISIACLRRFGDPLSDRKVKDMIRTFRRVHGFPICSRKGKPSGYWWARTEAEMQEFVDAWRLPVPRRGNDTEQDAQNKLPAAGRADGARPGGRGKG